MKKFEQYKLDLSKKEKDLVIKYLDKINHFIKKHSIEKELYNDIEEMVFEKLSKEKNLNQLKIIKILKEVGEPEVIFYDYLGDDYKNEEDKELFFEKLQSNGWARDNHNAIVLGISGVFAKKIGFPILAVRIILFVLMFFGGLSIWLYVIAGLIIPLKGKDYSGKNVYKYFIYQFKKIIEDGVYNITVMFSQIIKYIALKSGKLIKFCVTNVLPVFRFFIFGFLSLVLLSMLIGAIIIGAGYFTGFSINNIDFVSVLPNYFIIGIVCSIFALSIFTIFSFVYAISGKIISKIVLSLGGIFLLVSIFFGISTGFDLLQKYSSKNEMVKTTEINLGESGTGNLMIDFKINNSNDLLTSNYSIRNQNVNFINLENTTGSILKAEIKNTVFGNDEISKSVFAGLNNMILNNNNGNITLKYENDKTFNKKVPFNMLEREITLYIPEGYTFNFNNNYRVLILNANIKSKYEKYNDFLNNNCNNSKITFDKEKNTFICEPSVEDLNNAKQQYLQKYLVQNFDDFSPLKHKKRYKRDYINNRGYNTDWNFENFKWDNLNNLYFNFGDRSLDIEASVRIEDTSSGVLISDFKIDSVETDLDIFDKKYYEDTSPINEFID